jgi:hypothetical protein
VGYFFVPGADGEFLPFLDISQYCDAVAGKPATNQAPKALKFAAGEEGKAFETSLQRRNSVVIGRAPDCDVVIQDLKASRQHCRLTRNQDGFLLEDLGSKNGTYVDGQKITEPVFLKTNHTFKVGDTIFYLA